MNILESDDEKYVCNEGYELLLESSFSLEGPIKSIIKSSLERLNGNKTDNINYPGNFQKQPNKLHKV